MSATNRGAVRIDADFYPTPAWCVHRLLDAGVLPLELPRRCAFWLEPCAGDGAIMRAVTSYRHPYRFRSASWETMELREVDQGIAYQQTGDCLTLTPRNPPDVVITNPPFSLAHEIARHFVATQPSAYVALLLRLNVLGSGTKSGRSEWLRKNPPDVYVLPNRPSFAASMGCKAKCGWRAMLRVEEQRPPFCPSCGSVTSCSTTDATEYAWFVWTPERARAAGQIRVLAETPEEERRAA